ncbi:hypothetical protein PG985_005427 [Apiospora marii]|uniref:uncharacterized protein n=1 Tax=Apiospora marii TaxID=335849 RepID=UPI0031306B8E
MRNSARPPYRPATAAEPMSSTEVSPVSPPHQTDWGDAPVAKSVRDRVVSDSTRRSSTTGLRIASAAQQKKKYHQQQHRHHYRQQQQNEGRLSRSEVAAPIAQYTKISSPECDVDRMARMTLTQKGLKKMGVHLQDVAHQQRMMIDDTISCGTSR